MPVDHLDLVNATAVKADTHTNYPSQTLSLEIFQLFANGFAYSKSEGRDAALTPKKAGEVNSSSVTAVAQTSHQAPAN